MTVMMSIIEVLTVCLALGAGTADPQRYVFVGDPWRVAVSEAGDASAGSARILSRDGWSAAEEVSLPVSDGAATIVPDRPGLWVVTLKGEPPVEHRFLALPPPPAIDPAAMRRALPRQGDRLLAGAPIMLVAMGDSVTATGDYPQLLAMLLRRATGNHQINLEVRAFPGRSVDATVRTLDRDVLPQRPSIGLLMYGLNDQGAGTPLYAYLEQTRWIAARLARDCDADMVLLEPTPHIESPASTFRVIAFAQALGDLGAQLNLPVAATFNAIWGSGRTDLEQTIASMRPLFPPHYRKQWQSMTETKDKGDTIHPNVLGHLALAQAAFDAMVGRTPSPSPLRLSAEHAWTAAGLITRVHLALAGDRPRHGVLAFWSAADFTTPLLEPVAYHLEPDGVQEVVILWPTIRRPVDLLTLPESAGRSVMQPMLAVVDQSAGLTTARAIEPASPAPVTYLRSRLVTTDGVVEVPRTDGTTERVALGGEQAGEMLLQHDGAVSEMSFQRAGQVFPGEAAVDGSLDEWPQGGWTVLGEPVQARWTRGLDDRRAEPGECYLSWAFRAGAQGMYAAVQVQGDIARDQFTLFFDPRRMGELRTPGPYYWCSGGFDKSGKLNLRPGETSPKKVEGLAAVWRGGSDGQTGVMEMFIPYALFDCDAWPADGAMGFSIWWQHSGKGPGGGRTNLLWSERGHPWNTLRFGLLLRDDRPDAVLPHVVFIR